MQKNIQLNLSSHEWINEKETLLDLTGRNPGLNLLLGAKFLKEPWWGGGYVGTEIKAKKLISLIPKKTLAQSWIVTNHDKINSIPSSILNAKNLDINEDYFLVFIVNKERRNNNNSHNNIVKDETLYFWKPLAK